MGFLSKLMKSDVMKMALPMLLPYAMGPIFGSGIMGSMFGGMNPMARNMLQQSMLGYGTAALTGSKHPEKAAMYSGLASMPFSFMKANEAANMYNKGLENFDIDRFSTEPIMSEAVEPWWDYTGAGPGGLEQQLGIGSPGSSAVYNPGTPSKFTGKYQVPEWNKEAVANFLKQQEKLKADPIDAWDVIRGRKHLEKNILDVPFRREANVMKDVTRPIYNAEKQAMENVVMPTSEWRGGDPTLAATEMTMPEVDFYSKVSKGGKNLLGQELTKGETVTDWLPMIASQTAGLYGGRPTDEELWEDTKARRRKELAFMYGIDEDLMGGEMENPYYGGGGFWKDGGIAAREMDAGGAVNGPGGPKDDVIDAKLSDGEFVMTAKAVENLGGGDRMAGAKRMYNMMNQLDPQSETVQESVIGVS